MYSVFSKKMNASLFILSRRAQPNWQLQNCLWMYINRMHLCQIYCKKTQLKGSHPTCWNLTKLTTCQSKKVQLIKCTRLNIEITSYAPIKQIIPPFPAENKKLFYAHRAMPQHPSFTWSPNLNAMGHIIAWERRKSIATPYFSIKWCVSLTGFPLWSKAMRVPNKGFPGTQHEQKPHKLDISEFKPRNINKFRRNKMRKCL